MRLNSDFKWLLKNIGIYIFKKNYAIVDVKIPDYKVFFSLVCIEIIELISFKTNTNILNFLEYFKF